MQPLKRESLAQGLAHRTAGHLTTVRAKGMRAAMAELVAD
jgi:hypothetical protein